MKGSAKVLTKSRLFAEGYDLGFIEDCLFDERTWRLGYLVATLERTHDRKRVLISTNAIRAVDWDTPAINLSLSRHQLEQAPELEMKIPIVRHYDFPLRRYRWPFFFTGAGTFGVEGFPEPVALSPEDDIGFGHNLRAIGEFDNSIEDRHLRSIRDIDGYRIHASDGVFGHIKDFIFDVGTWKIKALLVDSQNWWDAKPVEVLPHDIKQISWEKAEVFVNVSKEHLVGAPYTESNTSL